MVLCYLQYYYRELLKPELIEQPTPLPSIPNIEKLRERIQSVISDICFVPVEDYWGREETQETFFLTKPVDSDYVAAVFKNLKCTLIDHYLELCVHASVILELDDRVTDTQYMIPMAALDKVEKLYDEMLEQYPEYIEQFFSAAVHIFNLNYRDPDQSISYSNLVDEDGELPF